MKTDYKGKKCPEDPRKQIPALLLVQKAAGNLPAFVPRDIRFRLFMERIIQRLIQEPFSLVGAYILAFLGAALGVGMQVYLTINIPEFIDTFRITNSLEWGVVVGAVFALGIFTTRVAMERFQTSAFLPRIGVGVILGTVFMNSAMLIFHLLRYNTPPSGLLIPVACLMIVLTFAVGSFLRSRLLRMLLASLSVFLAIVGTWWIHILYTASQLDLTPVFRYDYAWTLTQVSLVASAVALLIGIFGNLVNLSVEEV